MQSGDKSPHSKFVTSAASRRARYRCGRAWPAGRRGSTGSLLGCSTSRSGPTGFGNAGSADDNRVRVRDFRGGIDEFLIIARDGEAGQLAVLRFETTRGVRELHDRLVAVESDRFEDGARILDLLAIRDRSRRQRQASADRLFLL